MRILSITPFLRGAPIHPESGGKSAASLKITNALIQGGHEVFVLPWSKEYIWKETKFLTSNDASSATALPTLFFPRLTNLGKNLFRSFFTKKAIKKPKHHIWDYIRNSLYDKNIFLRKAMKRVKPDIVHIHYTHSDAIDYYSKLNSSVPVILTHHSNGIFDKLNLYDYTVFVCKHQHDLALDKYPEIKDKSCYIHNSVNETYFKPSQVKKTNRILFLSRFRPEKGLQNLLDAFAEDKRLDDYELLIIGEGKLEEQYKAFARKNNLDNVQFLGRLSKQQNAELMEQSSLFVVPSHGEGFALTYIEALCMGLPVIGYPPNVREHNEIFDMEAGYEFDANKKSPQHLAELIHKAMNSNLTDVEHRQKLKKVARDYFSFERFKDNYLKMYQKVLEMSV
ncbi:glycosyltransferase family 4 protein [Rhodohalobacter sp. 614A]|uniref:glycosyltransferase family 4 protein n=1 Tax=Rhodohalobacter sp. 614A TaxID=2908649 RepID=UPI001F2409F0|nr:glycosyltransferase family 4 protein [Rhodohalobacter sp. 614A]